MAVGHYTVCLASLGPRPAALRAARLQLDF